jgi:hypothetical protein
MTDKEPEVTRINGNIYIKNEGNIYYQLDMSTKCFYKGTLTTDELFDCGIQTKPTGDYYEGKFMN